jgi:hypothetical protein
MKINTKKLNQYFMSGNNSSEMKKLVEHCVEIYTKGEPNPTCIHILRDLGLLVEVE